MEQKQLKGLKPGEFFVLKPCEEPKEFQVYIKGDYDRFLKAYVCTKFDDICRTREFKSTVTVYVGFTF